MISELMRAQYRGDEQTVALLARGADVNAHARGFDGVAPINSAAANDCKPNETCTELVRLLLAHGADPNAAQSTGATALDTARVTQNEALAALLTALAERDTSPRQTS